MRQVDAIYLNKRGHNSDTSKWAYYRISSAGGMGHNIEMCLVKWPSFEDIDEVLSEHAAVVVNPGETGFASAYPNILKVLKSKAGIDHKDDDLIGIRARLPPHPLSLAWFIFYAPFRGYFGARR